MAVRDRPYALGTRTSIESSLKEISNLVERFNGDGFWQGREGNVYQAGFKKDGRVYRLTVPRPERGGKFQTEDQVQNEYKRRWRCLVLYAKSSMVAVEEQLTTTEAAFMQYLMLPDGRTVGETAPENIDEMYKTGQVRPLMLPGGSNG